MQNEFFYTSFPQTGITAYLMDYVDLIFLDDI